MFRRVFLIAPPTALAAVAVKQEVSEGQKAKEHLKSDMAHYICKPSDLPLYRPLHELKKPVAAAHPPKDSAMHQTIESGVRTVRTELQSGFNVLSKQTDQLNHYYETGVAHSQSAIDNLRAPHNMTHRVGAIAAGTFLGFLFGLRGGFIKKLFYTSVGGGAAASVCYPAEAEHYARETLIEAKKGFVIAYNFAMGIKPGDEIPKETINKFPTSVEELKYLVLDLYDEAKEVVLPSKK